MKVSAVGDRPTQHTTSSLVLFTKMDAKCDQHVTVVSRLLTALDHI